MRVRLRLVAGGVSLLMALASALLWGRSYRGCDRWTLQGIRPVTGGSEVVNVQGLSDCGSIEMLIDEGRLPSPSAASLKGSHMRLPPSALIFQSMNRTWAERLGVRLVAEPARFLRYQQAIRATRVIIDFPFWLPTACFLLFPLTMFLFRRRSAPGEARCRVCGYDLRATPARCPECGDVAAAAA